MNRAKYFFISVMFVLLLDKLVQSVYESESDEILNSGNPFCFWVITIKNPVKPHGNHNGEHDDLERVLVIEVEVVCIINGDVRQENNAHDVQNMNNQYTSRDEC